MTKLFSYLATLIEEWVAEHGQPIFGAKLKAWRHGIFNFSPLLIWYVFAVINNFSCNEKWMPPLVRNAVLLQLLFDIRLTGTQICHGFKVHDLITCKFKAQVVISLGSYWVLFALGSCWLLTHDMWHTLLQSENVFELGGITIIRYVIKQHFKVIHSTISYLFCQCDSI